MSHTVKKPFESIPHIQPVSFMMKLGNGYSVYMVGEDISVDFTSRSIPICTAETVELIVRNPDNEIRTMDVKMGMKCSNGHLTQNDFVWSGLTSDCVVCILDYVSRIIQEIPIH